MGKDRGVVIDQVRKEGWSLINVRVTHIVDYATTPPSEVSSVGHHFESLHLMEIPGMINMHIL